MSLFKSLQATGLEESRDSLGGFTLESDIYAGKIKVAYAQPAASGAMGIAMLFDFGGKEYRETVYVTNKNGENFYLNKNDATKKVPLPGFTTADDICLIVTGKPLCEQETEEKVVNVYDNDAKKELPKSVQMLVDLVGQDIRVAIKKRIENKSVKVGDEYVLTAETREANSIEKVFHPELHLTVVEARSGQEVAKFHDAWLERNKGKTLDKTTAVKDTANRAAPKAGAAPAAAASSNRPSLFGAKK